MRPRLTASQSCGSHSVKSSWTIARLRCWLRCWPRTQRGRTRCLRVAYPRRFLSAGRRRGGRSRSGSCRRPSRWVRAFACRARRGVGRLEGDRRLQLGRRLRRLAPSCRCGRHYPVPDLFARRRLQPIHLGKVDVSAQGECECATEQDGDEADRPDAPLQNCSADSRVVAEYRLVGTYHD